MKSSQRYTSQLTQFCWKLVLLPHTQSFSLSARNTFLKSERGKKNLNTPELADCAAEIRSDMWLFPNLVKHLEISLPPFLCSSKCLPSEETPALEEKNDMSAKPSDNRMSPSAEGRLQLNSPHPNTCHMACTNWNESPVWECNIKFSLVSVCQVLGSPGMIL